MASSQTDPFPADRSSKETRHQARHHMAGPAQARLPGDDEEDFDEGYDFLALVATAENITRQYQQQVLTAQLQRSYRAYRGQHAMGSKYLGIDWKGRSRLFMPKTRSAVRKNLAATAAALFGTEDVVDVSAEMEDDDVQNATAEVMGQDMNYRLTRTNRRSGMPWFMIAMGANFDAQLTNISCSKQKWEYLEEPTGEYETVLKTAIDEETGDIYEVEVEVEVKRVIADRPMSELVAIENIGIDPAAPWYDPIQKGSWFYADWPVRLSELRETMQAEPTEVDNTPWFEFDAGLALKGRIDDRQNSPRRQREGGTDRYEDNSSASDYDVVWIRENFFRLDGQDWHFWSVGRHGMLSEPRPTREAYPAFDGDRPYTLGFAQVEPHLIYSQSPVEAWSPLQMEINEFTNLRLDSLRRSIAPFTIYKKGAGVDLKQVSRRGRPDAMLGVNSVDDVKFVETPGPNGQAYTDAAQLAANFDELAGVFSTSSVQNNRQLNETVGGMRLMSGSANAVSEFDLRVWVETWYEPTLRQILQLVRHNESDERIMRIAANKADIMRRFDYMPKISDYELTEATLRVNVGIGASDPMQKIAKLKAALEMVAPFFEAMAAQGIQFNFEEFIKEAMGAAGFRDGMRFFTFGDPPQQQPDPALLKVQVDADKVKAGREKAALDNKTRLDVERMRGENNIKKQAIDLYGDRERRDHEKIQSYISRFVDSIEREKDSAREKAQAA